MKSEEYFFHQRYKKAATNTVMASRFWLPAYVVRLSDSHFSLVDFSRMKCILAHKVRHSVLVKMIDFNGDQG